MTTTFSVYVPHVFPNFDKKYVAEVFSKYGIVKEIDFVSKLGRDGKPYNSVYVHLNNVNHKFQRDVLEKVESGEPHTILYDAPWHWIVLPNTAKKHVPGDRKLKIDLGDAKAISITRNTSHEFNEVDNQVMDEIQKMIEDEEANLASFDRRYVHTIEQENFTMRVEIDQLRNEVTSLKQMYQAEVQKVRTLYGVDL
jgi:hypothetical protein